MRALCLKSGDDVGIKVNEFETRVADLGNSKPTFNYDDTGVVVVDHPMDRFCEERRR